MTSGSMGLEVIKEPADILEVMASPGVADAFRDGNAVILEHEFDPKPWKSQMFSAMTDATSFLVAARYYMKLDPQTKKDKGRHRGCMAPPNSPNIFI